MLYQDRNCICCDSGHTETLYEIPGVRVMPEIVDTDLDLTVQICCDCGMVFLNPIAEDSFYREYYRDSLRVVADGEGAARRGKRREQYEFCKSRIPHCGAGGRVYDIGAHDGSLLNFFQVDGWLVGGCDLSVSGPEFAFAKYGIKLDHADFLQTDHPDACFDVVTIFQVLEHIIDPGPLLAEIRRVLKPEGMLIIEVPNLDKPSDRNLANYFDFEHVSYFELGSLANLLAATGFSVQESDVNPLNNALRVVARIGSSDSCPSNHYRENRSRVLAYKEGYSRIVEQIESRLTPVLSRKIVLYGAGQHTEQLLREVEIARRLEVVAIVDSNREKWGSRVFGFEVRSPDWLADRDFHVVVISSFSFASAIEETIRKINPGIRIVGLYDA